MSYIENSFSSFTFIGKIHRIGNPPHIYLLSDHWSRIWQSNNFGECFEKWNFHAESCRINLFIQYICIKYIETTVQADIPRAIRSSSFF